METETRGHGDTMNRTMGNGRNEPLSHTHADSKDYQFSHAFNEEFHFMKASLEIKFTRGTCSLQLGKCLDGKMHSVKPHKYIIYNFFRVKIISTYIIIYQRFDLNGRSFLSEWFYQGFYNVLHYLYR